MGVVICPTHGRGPESVRGCLHVEGPHSAAVVHPELDGEEMFPVYLCAACLKASGLEPGAKFDVETCAPEAADLVVRGSQPRCRACIFGDETPS
jgi:hypothetical protein